MAKKDVTRNVEANDALNKKEALFIQYRKPILIAVAALVVVVLGFFIFKNFYLEPRANKASTELAKGQQYLETEQYDKALNGDKVSYAGFLKIAEEYGNTDAGNLANLYAGICFAKQNKWNEALKSFETYSTTDDALVAPAAVNAMAAAYANTNQLDKAVDTYKKAAEMADSRAEDGVNNSISPQFLLYAGDILIQQGKKDEALKIYQDIKKKYINSMVYQEIDKYIERASVK
ncbi:tetratricopeptide repeat protein [Prevotella sp. OH937_COT-195]|uniref:tetratricopeptide repeat protein n=1 Tax=Prevotella sp. OH937_COT-195 TaxID=2491051 RepID=UPI000F647CB3|nr:tetratricopeptide repeat protein [Prevotella sp. OH937_COT-195]RRD03012.1 hypothetical protein EII32_00730 [Prevotella sp. OH937_COT-195]